jgi:predicted enzyme related to lactoylglutathione lyase
MKTQLTTGVHMIIYSKDAEADKVFFRDVLKFTNVDVGDGWLIFGLPASELAVHPSSPAENGHHEIYLICDDIKAFVKEMTMQKIACSKIDNQGWGMLSQISLPGGSKLGVYQPRHARPKPMDEKTPARKIAAKKAAANKPAAGKKAVANKKRKK